MSATVDIRANAGSVRRIRTIARQRRSNRRGYGAFTASLLVFIAFLGMSLLFVAVPSKPETVLALGVGLTVVLAIVRWPVTGTFISLLVAIFFDSLPSNVVSAPVSELGIFRNLSYRGLPDFVWISLFEIIVVLTLCSVLFKRFHARQGMARGAVLGPILLYGAIVMFGEFNGLLTGGDFKISLWELRPLLYICGLYLLAVNTIREPWQIRAVLWISVLATGLRSLDGVVRYFSMTPDIKAVAEVVLEHDDSLVVAALLALVLPVVLWRSKLQKRFVWTVVALAPLCLYIVAINHRRAAYFCLVLSLLSMLPFIWNSLRTRKARVRMMQVLGALAVIVPVYIGVFWNSNGSLGQPAQAIRSIVAPNERDYLSNLYRVQEDTNIKATINQSPAIGIGFGKPMQEVVKMVDLTNIWALQLYMPHDNMLWLWMRMGIVGFAIFWLMVGSSLILIGAAVRLAVARLRMLTAEEAVENSKGKTISNVPGARGLSGSGAGLRVVKLVPPTNQAHTVHTRNDAAARAHRRQVLECAEFMILAFLAEAVLVSMVTLAVVDQGLMSPRLSSYWGIVLGTLAAAWEMYRIRFRTSEAGPLITEQPAPDPYKEIDSASGKGTRVRVITGPRTAA